MRRSDLCVFLGALVLLMLPGCGGVLSDHPLSNATDSVVDERLIGWWERIPDPGAAGTPTRRFVIGRVPDTEHTLELVTLELKPDDTVKVGRLRIYTVQLGDTWYLTLADEDEDETTFAIARYRIDAGGALTLEGLDEEATAQAIEKGVVEGRVKRNPKHTGAAPTERKFEEVRLTADSAALRAWLTKVGTAAFTRSEKPIVRRVAIPRSGRRAVK